QGEKAKIEGRMFKDLRKIESEAYRKAEEIKGKAEGLASAIYAKSFRVDPKFYEFIRSMDAYKRSMNAEGKFILSSDSQFLKYFKNDR
ncbi:MAG: hypothetical protein KC493_04330, partial [Bacteriovoracaceae bacterium]|nr:hypothetical protein [Bacteriovoracaceae bacterium]